MYTSTPATGSVSFFNLDIIISLTLFVVLSAVVQEVLVSVLASVAFSIVKPLYRDHSLAEL